MKYRPQRGSYSESMVECVRLKDAKALINYIRRTWRAANADNVTVEWYCYDERNGWDTYLVSVDGKAVGYTDEEVVW